MKAHYTPSKITPARYTYLDDEGEMWFEIIQASHDLMIWIVYDYFGKEQFTGNLADCKTTVTKFAKPFTV